METEYSEYKLRSSRKGKSIAVPDQIFRTTHSIVYLLNGEGEEHVDEWALEADAGKAFFLLNEYGVSDLPVSLGLRAASRYDKDSLRDVIWLGIARAQAYRGIHIHPKGPAAYRATPVDLNLLLEESTEIIDNLYERAVYENWVAGRTYVRPEPWDSPKMYEGHLGIELSRLELRRENAIFKAKKDRKQKEMLPYFTPDWFDRPQKTVKKVVKKVVA